ncbi:hypothetical protein ABIA53_002385 [Pseudomonas monsensis]
MVIRETTLFLIFYFLIKIKSLVTHTAHINPQGRTVRKADTCERDKFIIIKAPHSDAKQKVKRGQNTFLEHFLNVVCPIILRPSAVYLYLSGKRQEAASAACCNPGMPECGISNQYWNFVFTCSPSR